MNQGSPKKPDNIVKKVFDRSGPKSDRISALFTHYKNPKAKKDAVKNEQVRTKKAPKQPAYAKKLPAAIDFGASRVKLFQMALDSRGGYEVVLMDEELNDLSQGTSLVQTQQALRKLTKRNAIGPQVVVGLPAREAQTFNFTFPAMADTELRDAVKWKIKQLRPFDQDIEQIKYTLLRWENGGLTSSSTQRRVTAVCVSSESISQKNTLLNEVGLKPASVYVSPLALMQVKKFNKPEKQTEELVLWLDLGADESVFILEKNGTVQYMRNLSITGKALTRQIAQVCHVADVEAEELKKKFGLEAWTPNWQSLNVTEEEKAANPGISVCSALTSMLENLVLDVEHSFKHFSYQVTQSQVTKFDRLMITGGGANLKKIEGFLQDRLGVPVEKADPFSTLRISETVRAQRADQAQDALTFAAVAGLTFTQISDRAGLLDLMRVEKKKAANPFIEKVKHQPKFAASLGVVAIILMILPQIGVLAFYKRQAELSNRLVKEARTDINQKQTVQLEMAEQEKKLLAEKELLEEKLEILKKSGRDQRDFSDLLEKISALLPDEIWVTKMTYAEKKLTLIGSTAQNDLIVTFLDNLKKPDDFSDVVFNYTQRDPNSSIYTFEVMMNVK